MIKYKFKFSDYRYYLTNEFERLISKRRICGFQCRIGSNNRKSDYVYNNCYCIRSFNGYNNYAWTENGREEKKELAWILGNSILIFLVLTIIFFYQKGHSLGKIQCKKHSYIGCSYCFTGFSNTNILYDYYCYRK